MAFRVIRQRREQRRAAKLDDIFQAGGHFNCINDTLPLLYHFTLGKPSKKKTEKSDIVQKGRVGWTPKSYF